MDTWKVHTQTLDSCMVYLPTFGQDIQWNSHWDWQFMYTHTPPKKTNIALENWLGDDRLPFWVVPFKVDEFIHFPEDISQLITKEVVTVVTSWWFWWPLVKSFVDLGKSFGNLHDCQENPMINYPVNLKILGFQIDPHLTGKYKKIPGSQSLPQGLTG